MSESLVALSVDKEIIEKTREILKSEHYLNFESTGDIFLYAMALGKNKRMPLKSKEAFFRMEYLKKTPGAEALIYAMVVPYLEEGVEEIDNDNKVYEIAEELANTGFRYMINEYDNFNEENSIKKMILQLNEMYESISAEP